MNKQNKVNKGDTIRFMNGVTWTVIKLRPFTILVCTNGHNCYKAKSDRKEWNKYNNLED